MAQRSKGYAPTDWVVTFNGGVHQAAKTSLAITRLATPEEVAAKLARLTASGEAQAQRLEREARQDWQDASYIAACFDHDRERAIAALGADTLADIATKLKAS